MKFIIFALFAVSSVSNAAEWSLDRTNKVGVRLVDTFSEEKGHYYIGGKDLGTKLPPNVLRSWNAISNFKGKAGAQCYSGTFTFTKKNGGKEVQQEGCTDGVAYGSLIGHIETVRDYARGSVK
jgi:hypothetical protein